MARSATGPHGRYSLYFEMIGRVIIANGLNPQRRECRSSLAQDNTMPMKSFGLEAHLNPVWQTVCAASKRYAISSAAFPPLALRAGS